MEEILFFAIYDNTDNTFNEEDIAFRSHNGETHTAIETDASWDTIASNLYVGLGLGGCAGTVSQGCILEIANVSANCLVGVDGAGNIWYKDNNNYVDCAVGYYYR